MALIKIASLWKNKTKDGTEYFSGYLGDAKILLMENSNRDPEKKHPTHNLLISEKDMEYRKKEVDKYHKGSNATYDNSVSSTMPASSSWDDDDIAF